MPLVKHMQALRAQLALYAGQDSGNKLQIDSDALEDLLRRRMFVVPAFEVMLAPPCTPLFLRLMWPAPCSRSTTAPLACSTSARRVAPSRTTCCACGASTSSWMRACLRSRPPR